MKKKDLYVNTIFFTALTVFSITINIHYGNIGVFPIDTFAFFDTAYGILLNKHPFKDVWVTTGPFVDYLQAFFFTLSGLNWFSYLLHASFLNFLITITIFFTLKKLGLSSYYSFFYSLSVATLCYPVAGTPFAYQHSYILSIISLMILFLSIKIKSNFLWFLLPFTMTFAFLSMHVPASYVNLVLIVSIFLYFVFNYNLSKIISFLLGSVSIVIITMLFFVYFEIPVSKFIQQYILFPISMGEYRLSNPDYAYSLEANLTFRRIVGHFKFIHIFLFFIMTSIIIILFNKKKNFNKKEDLIIYGSMIATTFLIIFHQLITANQTFIFSIIPVLAGLSHVLVERYFSKKNFYKLIILSLVILVTVKYHLEYNVKRKFMDLQNTDLSKAVNASLLDKKFENLKWINPFFSGNPQDEINLLKNTAEAIKDDDREKMVITNYQFFSVILEEDLNIPNRWYLRTASASHPQKDHKYYKFYKDHFEKILSKNNIQVIYTVGFSNNKTIRLQKDFESYTDNICFDKFVINGISSGFKLRKCR